MKRTSETAAIDHSQDANEPAWRKRALSRSLSAARSRAEQRIQRFMDAAFELIDEKGTTDFTIQQVIDRSKQSLRNFYQYFDGRDELILALFEETVRQSAADIREAVEAETGPIERLRAFTICLHEWCEPVETPRKRGEHYRRPISEFSMQLAMKHPGPVRAALVPVSRVLLELLEAAVAAEVIDVADTRRTALLIEQTIMYSWFGNHLVQDPRLRVTAEETWEFCLHGLRGEQARARGPRRR